MASGVDYPWQHPGGAALEAARVRFVGRYLSHDKSKTLMRPEADDLKAHGIPVFVVYEDTATRASEGHQAGVNDGVAAMKMVSGSLAGYTDLSMPSDRPIFFACDFDANWNQVSDYIAGAGLAIGRSRVGVYGGLDVITGAAASGYKWLWQTGAWSHGSWHPAAQIRQLIKTRTINNVVCDVDQSMTEDFGQWFPGVATLTKEVPMTDAEIQAVADRVVAGITAVGPRNALALANMWWLDHALNGTTTPSMTADQKALIASIHGALQKLGPAPK